MDAVAEGCGIAGPLTADRAAAMPARGSGRGPWGLADEWSNFKDFT